MKNVALITGASSGIGRELAIIHARHGGDLVIVARRFERLEKLKNELESKYNITVLPIKKDLSIRESSKELYDEIKSQDIKVEYLINCAGFGGAGTFLSKSYKYNQDMVMVNVLAVSSLTHLFLDDFIKQDKGKILNVSSTAALCEGIPLHSLYAATKKFEKVLTHSLQYECKDSNVTLTALIPDFTKTEFNEVAGFQDVGINPTEVAIKGYNGMLKGRYSVTVGFPLSRKFLSLIQPFFTMNFRLKAMNDFIKRRFNIIKDYN